MNNLYHRFAVASVGIALGFALGANKEATAATLTFTFTSTRSYWVVDTNYDKVVDDGTDYPGPRYVGINNEEGSPPWERGEYRSSYEFNIADLPLDSNTRIKSATFQTRIESVGYIDTHNNNFVSAYGFTEYSPLIDNGEYLDYDTLYGGDRRLIFNILHFVVNQKINNNNNSFGLSIRPITEVFFTLPYQANLTITTEAVPEPTTIFGSALALGVGGWLKRKKSSQKNKTTPQG
jgi:hypothetical protein